MDRFLKIFLLETKNINLEIFCFKIRIYKKYFQNIWNLLDYVLEYIDWSFDTNFPQ